MDKWSREGRERYEALLQCVEFTMIKSKSDWMEHADYQKTRADGQHWIRLWAPWSDRLRNLNFTP